MNDVKNRYEDEYVTMWMENNVLFAEYKNILITLDAAKTIVQERLKMFNGKTYPCLVYMMNKVDYTKDSRDFFASEDGGKGMKCLALIISNPVQRIMGNFYLILSKPTIPTRLFTNKDDALSWVNTYVS